MHVPAPPPSSTQPSRNGRLPGAGGPRVAASPAAARGGWPWDGLTWLVLVGALVAYGVLATGYALWTPIWQNPDEPAHYTYVAFVAQTGGLPELRPGDWDAALLERLKTGQLRPEDRVEDIGYEFWQPPLSYLLAAPVWLIGPRASAAEVVPRLRLFDAVFGGLTLVVALVAARQVLPPGPARAVPLVLAGVPMFTAVSASVSADPLANLLAAGLVVLLLARAQAPPGANRRWAVVVGVGLGLGLLTKLALGIFLPLAVALILLRSTQRWRELGLLGGVVALLLLPWLAHQVTTYGWTDPLASRRHAEVVLDQARFPGLSLAYLGQFLPVSFHSFWAQFGWMGIVAPERLYWAYGIVVVAALVGLLREWRRFRELAWQVLVAVVLAALVGYIGYNLAFQQFQGRYMFTALVPLGVLLVAGWAALVPRRARAPVTLGLGLVLIALNVYALTRVMLPGFAPAG